MPQKPIQYFVAVAGFELLCAEIQGTEELSKPWRIEAKMPLDPQTMRGVPEAFDPDDVIKKDAMLILRRGSGDVFGGTEMRTVQGVVTSAHMTAAITGVPMVTLVLEPRFALLRLRWDVRSHRDLTAPQIVTEVAEALGVKIDNRLTESYPVRPYCVQWRESDFDYCMRLMEDEGIFYYFTHGDVMVLGDSASAYEPIVGNPVLSLNPGAGMHQHDEAVHRFGSRARLVPGKVTLRDWNTEHPNLDMDVKHETSMSFAPEWYDYPGEYEEPSEGTRKARLHAEAYDRQAAMAAGESNSGRLYPGSTFTLETRVPGTRPGELVVRKIVHAWDEDAGDFNLRFDADGADVVYRAPRTTYVPTLFNPHTGIVCTNGEDIQCDHFGRVKVRQHWDRIRPYDDDCSHWIPVLQDNTGGSSAIARKDWEVMVHFLEGDPDRPIVLGRVYNGEDQFTERLPAAKDRSGLKSMTSPTRDGSNEIRFEDYQGQENMFLHAIKDQTVRIANDHTKQVGNSDVIVIKNDETVSIGGDCRWNIGDKLTPLVENDQTWEVGGDRKINVGKTLNSSVGHDHKMTISGNHERKIFSEDTCSADNFKETIDGDHREKFKKVHQTVFQKKLELNVEGSYTETAKVQKGETTTEERIDEITVNHTIMTEDVFQGRVDETRKLTITGSLLAKVLKVTNLTGADEEIKTHSKTASYTGLTDVTFKVKNTTIVLKSGLVRFDAPDGDIFFAISGASDHGAKLSKQN